MNKYELALVLTTTIDEEARVAEFNRVQDTITRFGGVVDKVDDWGKRRLGYPIKKQNDGYFSFTAFTSESSAPFEIESRVRIMESVLRYLIIRVE